MSKTKRWQIFAVQPMSFSRNKKVLLRERKRYTAGHVANARSAVLSREEGGISILTWGTLQVWTDKLKSLPSPILRMRAEFTDRVDSTREGSGVFSKCFHWIRWIQWQKKF